MKILLKKDAGHYAQIADIYRSLRVTDSEPVLYIKEIIGDKGKITAADVGAGAGRYARLFFEYLGKENLFLYCYDTNEFMLESLEKYLDDHDIRNYATKIAMAQELPIADKALDAIFCFNAIHFFNTPKFLRESARVLRKGSFLFIYTRTKTQSMKSIWGKHFPSFNQKESDLYKTDSLESEIKGTQGLELMEMKTFSLSRENSLKELTERAQSKHYSTFYLYESQEFERSLAEFRENIRESYKDPGKIKWSDEKTMYVVLRKQLG